MMTTMELDEDLFYKDTEEYYDEMENPESPMIVIPPENHRNELEKNSSILVTVDDLNEGLIVVSYTYKDNLYQGVLLQLNRERGIPSGISFPKDVCTRNIFPTDDGEKDPSQIPPLNQRHTYFQEPGPESSNRVGPRVGLRRIIKPPARFKNSRMSLRLRARPVLCAKCKTLCEEKSDNNGDSGEPEKSKTKSSQKTSGTSVRRGIAKLELVGTNGGAPTVDNEPPNTSNDTSNPIPDDADFSYESVGTKNIVENYWRRPLTKPNDQNGKAKANSQTSLDPVVRPLQNPKPELKPSSLQSLLRIPPPVCLNPVDFSLDNRLTEDVNLLSNNDTGKKDDPIGKPRKSRKSRSQKLCVNSVEEDHTDEVVNPVLENSGPEAYALDCIPHADKETPFDPIPVPEPLPVVELSSNYVQPPRRQIRRLKSAEARSQSRKRSSTVPVRFRDDSYLTRKNVFSFKKQREDKTEVEATMPTLPTITTTATTDVDDFVQNPVSLTPPWQCENYCEKQEAEVPLNELNSSTSSSSGSASSSQTPVPNSNGHAGVSDIKKEPTTGGKIPVIRITFGSPGNGIVVSATTVSESDSKAARKAMRKAKKEARRKFVLNSNLPIPHVPVLSPGGTIRFEPRPRVETDDGRNSAEFMDFDDEDPPSPAYEAITPQKRKKKDKKRRRSKPPKDLRNSDMHDVG